MTIIEMLTNNAWEDITSEFSYPVDLQKTLDESLDSGLLVMTASTRREKYPNWSKLKITQGNLVTYWFCNDTVDSVRTGEIYKHNFVLWEPTKVLERIFIDGKSVTQPLVGSTLSEIIGDTITLAAAFKMLLEVTPVRTSTSQVQPYILDPSVESKMTAACPEFKFTAKMNLFEVACEYGHVIDAMPRIVPNANDDRVWNTITFDFFNVLGDVKTVNSAAEHIEQAESDYCGELVINAEHVVGEPVTYPGTGLLAPLVSEDIRLTDENGCLIVANDIERVIDLTLAVEAASAIEIPKPDNANVTYHIGYKVLLKNLVTNGYVKEITEWTSLDEKPTLAIQAGERVKNNCLFYTRGRNVLDGFGRRYKNTLIGWTSNSILQNLITGAFEDTGETCDILFDWWAYSSSGTKVRVLDAEVQAAINAYVTTPSVATFSGSPYGMIITLPKSIIVDQSRRVIISNPSSTVAFKSTYCNITYVPYISAKLSAKKEVNGDGYALSYEQSAESIDYESLSHNVWAAAQRCGSETEQQVCYVATLSGMADVGDIIGGKVVTNVRWREIGVDNYVIVYTLSKDFNRISEYIAQKRAYRNYAIPATTCVKREVKIDEKCVISDTEMPGNCTVLTHSGIQSYLRSLRSGTSNVATVATLRGYIDELPSELFGGNITRVSGNRVALELCCNSFGKSLVIKAKTFDNYSAGRKRDGEYTIQNANYNICRDVDYTVNGGTLKKINFDVYAKMALLSSYDMMEYPHLDNGGLGEVEISSNIDYEESIKLIEVDALVHKDAGEQLNVTYQLHTVTDIDTLIIGFELHKNNGLLVGNRDNWLCLTCLDKPLSKFATRITGELGVIADTSVLSSQYITDANSVTNAFSLTISGLDTTKAAWALTDAEGNIYIAENGIPAATRTLYFNFRRE